MTAEEGDDVEDRDREEGERDAVRLLFACVRNRCRSQMAEGFARLHGGAAIEAHSAGSAPGDEIHPLAVSLMAERGVDLSGRHPKSVDELPDTTFDVLVSMGCGDRCPTARARRRLEWDVPDPEELSPEEFRAVRDDVEERVLALIRSVGARPEGDPPDGDLPEGDPSKGDRPDGARAGGARGSRA